MCTYLPLDAETPEENKCVILWKIRDLLQYFPIFLLIPEIGVLVINLEELKLGKYSCNKLGLIKPAEIVHISFIHLVQLASPRA